MNDRLIGLVLSSSMGIVAILNFTNKGRSAGTLNLTYAGDEMHGLDGNASRTLSEFFRKNPVKVKLEKATSHFQNAPVMLTIKDISHELTGHVVPMEIPEFTVIKAGRHFKQEAHEVHVIADAVALMIIDPTNQKFGSFERISTDFDLFNAESSTALEYKTVEEAAQAMRDAAKRLEEEATRFVDRFNKIGFVSDISISLSQNEDTPFYGSLSACGNIEVATEQSVRSKLRAHLNYAMDKASKLKEVVNRRAKLEEELKKADEELQKLS